MRCALRGSGASCCAWLQYLTQVGHIQGGNVEYPVSRESHTTVTLTASLLSMVCYILWINTLATKIHSPFTTWYCSTVDIAECYFIFVSYFWFRLVLVLI